MKRVDHAEASSHFIKSKEHLEFHDRRLWDLRQKRDREAEAIPEWEELRALASAITGASVRFSGSPGLAFPTACSTRSMARSTSIGCKMPSGDAM